MLTIFPNLLDYGLISPFLIRISIGLIGLIASKRRLSKDYKWISVLYFVTSVFLIIGLYTQIVVMLGFLLVWLDYTLDRKTMALNKEAVTLRAFISVVIISLIFTGPGFLAFDLPL